MKSLGYQAVSLMGLLFGIKAVHPDGLTVHHYGHTEFILRGGHALRNLLVPLIVFILAVLTWRADAKVAPTVVGRITVLVVDEVTIGDLNSLHGENDPVDSGVQLNTRISKLNSFGGDTSPVSVLVDNNTCFSSSGTSVEASPSVFLLKVMSWSFSPDQLSGLFVVDKALLQILPRREIDGRFHNQLRGYGFRRIWEPNTPRCAALLPVAATNVNPFN